MNHPEQTPKKPTDTTGIFALLCALLGVGGTRASKMGRWALIAGPSSVRRPGRTFHPLSRLKCCVPVLLGAVVGLLAFTTAPALAAAPEAPVITGIEGGKPSEATFHGVVNPNNPPSEAGFYQFVYRATSAGTCKGAGELKAPAAPAVFPGISQGEEVGAETVTGLKPNSEYAVCIVAYNNAKTEEAPSAPVTFTTAPEAPETLSPAKLITATTTTFEGVLNPKAAAAVKAGWYFAYSTEAKCTENALTSSLESEAVVKAQTESKKVIELQPNKKYEFCLVATNEAGAQSTPGNEVSVETIPAPPEVLAGTESAAPVTPDEETLNAQVNPNNQETKYQFEYSTKATGEALEGTIVKVPSTPGTLPAVFNSAGEPVSAPTEPLVQNTTYYYRVTAENVAHEKAKAGKVEHFTTLLETPEGEEANPVGTTSATLNGVLSPNATVAGEAGTYEFLYRQSASECQGEGGKTAPVPAGTAHGAAKEAVSQTLTGLPPDTTYTFCLLERNTANETAVGAPTTFTTHGAGISEEQVTGIEASAATLQASINPNESKTSYHFEYDTTPYTAGAAHGTSVTQDGKEAEEEIGSGTSPVSRSVGLKGLEPGTTYYYRVVAVDEIETFYGPNKTFTTNPTPGTEPPQNCPNEQRRVEQPYGQTLPDCRAYEMVSPVETSGFDATITSAGLVRASEDREQEIAGEAAAPAITYVSRGSFAEPHGSEIHNQVLSRRNEQEGRWETQSITAPDEHDKNAEFPIGYIGMFFTPELTEGLTETAAHLTTAPEAAPEGLHELYLAGFPENPDEPISYRLVSQLPPSEEIYAEPYKLGPGVYPLGASSNLTDVVFATEREGPTTIGPLREWNKNSGRVVSVGVSNTPGEVSTDAIVGSDQFSLREHGLEQGEADVWRAVSEDGSRVIFTQAGGELDARVNVGSEAGPEPEREQSNMNGEECTEPAKACTVKLSAGAASYVGASTDDSKIFYIENKDLYEYELPLGSVKGQAKALTSGGKVQGVTQISEDGSYVYFVAKDALKGTHGESLSNAAGKEPVEEEDNLYLDHYEHGTWTTAFIATLSAGDTSDWEEGPGGDSAVLAPDASGLAGGARLAFTSDQSLTGYDNAGYDEIYLYDAESSSHPSSLVCASCNPSGARPVGSASLATGSYDGEGASNYRPRDLLADGSLFFDSSDALVPHASDGRQNVYEYEDGHIYAISNVSGGQSSYFLDASPDGQDVFFASADKLLPEDTGDNVAVWDAREDGGFPVLPAAPSCNNADACKPPESAQPSVFAPTGSATFNGLGDLPPASAVVKKVTTKKPVKCKKGEVKKKVKKKETCVKKPKKKSKAKRASRNRRTQS
jgi:hypothetical protein